MMKRIYIRTALIIAYIGLAVFLFVTFRGHTLLVDNNDAGDFIAPSMVEVSIDQKKAVDFFRRDRDRFMVVGSKHTVRVTIGESGQDFEKTIYLPLKDDMYLLSIPKLLNNEPCVEVFKPAPNIPAPEEEEKIGGWEG